FFQAEDGIRDRNVTGVQTCALPIFPLYFTSRSIPVQPIYAVRGSMLVLGMDEQLAKQVPLTSNTVSVGGDGTFDVTITASPGWSTGKHTIKASESLTHRSAELDFIIYAAGTTPPPTSTDTASPSPTTTLTTTSPGLSC